MPNQYPGGTEEDGLLAGSWASPATTKVQSMAVKHNSLRITQVIWFKVSFNNSRVTRTYAHETTEANVVNGMPKRKKIQEFICAFNPFVDAIL